MYVSVGRLGGKRNENRKTSGGWDVITWPLFPKILILKFFNVCRSS